MDWKVKKKKLKFYSEIEFIQVKGVKKLSIYKRTKEKIKKKLIFLLIYAKFLFCILFLKSKEKIRKGKKCVEIIKPHAHKKNFL